ncbi:MAG TPA: sugar phosphate isomerase [Chitinophagaceae bacterium]|nr:sugar phosphate isomerase [Chitinophagaceae bacterium]
MQSNQRRKFIQQASMLSLGALLLQRNSFASLLAGNKIFGIQVYSVKEDMAKDPKATLKQLSKYGYKKIESFEGPQGIFWGMTNKEYAAYLKGLGMQPTSSHCDISKDFERKAAEAAEIGMEYLICPYKGAQKSIDDYKRIADEFNQKGEICKKNGIRFAYHNHDYTFKLVGGQMPQDVLMNNTDANLVDFEMDMYWVVTAGASPEAYFKKYPGRFRLVHIKDRTKSAVSIFDSCNLGTGSIDYTKLIPIAEQYGVRHLMVEQEKYTDTTPMDAAKANAKYMRATLSSWD